MTKKVLSIVLCVIMVISIAMTSLATDNVGVVSESYVIEDKTESRRATENEIKIYTCYDLGTNLQETKNAGKSIREEVLENATCWIWKSLII